jgi:hypothetical protein
VNPLPAENSRLGSLPRLAAAAVTIASAFAGLAVWTGTISPNPAQVSASFSTRAGHGPLAAARLSRIQAAAKVAIAARQDYLGPAETLVASGSPMLTAADRSALLALLHKDAAGLVQLGSSIAAAQEASVAWPEYRAIFLDYRVFRLALPQVHLVRAVDNITGAILPRLANAQSALIAAAASTGKSQLIAADMSVLGNNIASIKSATDGLDSTILAYTPEQFDANPMLLVQVRTDLVKVRSDIVAARNAALAARQALL